MKIVILAGGMGTRLQEETTIKPKPMVDIGENPMLWHIMKIYSSFNFKEFIIALGYKGEWIKKYFINYYHLCHDFSIETKNGRIDVNEEVKDDWTVHLVDTGLNTQTGGRIKRLSSLIGNETFMMTYGDGLADINISELLAFHRQHGKLATVTAVRPEARFGEISMDGTQVTKFAEKSQVGEGWINGGFFVLEPKVLDYIEGDDTYFELDPLAKLVSEGQLIAYKHKGFWQPADTLRDIRFLESLWTGGKAPWKMWK